jgi:hypothetical protein
MSRSPNCVGRGTKISAVFLQIKVPGNKRDPEIKSESSYFLKILFFFKNGGRTSFSQYHPLTPLPCMINTSVRNIKKFNILFSVYFFELIEI